MTGASFIVTNSAKALSGSNFNAGRIIDDTVFTNKDSMTVQQIQDFLNSKVPTCNRWHSAYNADNPPPYTCLKEYQENTTTGENNFARFNGDGSPYNVPGGKSAAQIIWDSAQAYNINPQALIVLLQKEQGLVTDDWPLLSQFTKATGYLCPDTAPCSASAGGFGKQVVGAAWQFRHDLDGIDTPNYWSPYGKGWNNILYSPNAACGTKSVYIENQATAVLYKYTPYTPNSAALNNLYGLGDGCSAYGNRNFWRYFNDWFGSTLAPAFSWQYQGQNVYTDSNKQVAIDSYSQALSPDTRYYLTLSAKNTGNVTWQQSNMRLGTSRNSDRTSILYDPTWLSAPRPASMIEPSVAPGETAHFEFWVKTPNSAFNGKEYFNLVYDGVTWLNDVGLNWVVNIQ